MDTSLLPGLTGLLLALEAMLAVVGAVLAALVLRDLRGAARQELVRSPARPGEQARRQTSRQVHPRTVRHDRRA